MATVKDNIVKLLSIIDPTMKDGTIITTSNISTWASSNGDKFTADRVMDIYNDARMALFQSMKVVFDEDQLSKEVGALVTSITNLSFTLTGSISVASKPSGYIKFIGMSNADNVPIILLPNYMISDVRSGRNEFLTQSSTTIYVFDIGSQFVHYGTLVPTASTYNLQYYGISNFTLSDVTTYSTNETYNEVWIPSILELAVAIANGLGNQQVNELAKKLITAK